MKVSRRGSKAKSRAPCADAPPEGKVVDLMERLRQSLEASRDAKTPAPAKAKSGRAAAAKKKNRAA